jgi:VWFA-related protein
MVCSLLLAASGAVIAYPPGARQVTLSVLAVDSHDQPVGDLSSEDFQVSDNGKPQRIVLFRRNEGAPQLAAPPKPGDSPDQPRVSPAVVILFDLLNANFSNRGYGVEEIIHALEHLESSDSLYLYLLTNGGSLYPVHALPGTDAEAASKTPWTQQIRPLLNSAVNNVYGLKPVDETQVAIRIETTYRALEMLASKMASIPGRKNVVWITHGLPTIIRMADGEPYDYSPKLQRLATALDQSGMTLNSVDQGSEPGSGAADTLKQFADLTGGRVYPSDLDKAISGVMSASRSGYQIDYAAPPPDGKYHKIRVTCSRKGIRIQTEQGYYSNPK